MEAGKLKFNSDKTDIIISSTKQQRNRVIRHFPVNLVGSDSFLLDNVRDVAYLCH